MPWASNGVRQHHVERSEIGHTDSWWRPSCWSYGPDAVGWKVSDYPWPDIEVCRRPKCRAAYTAEGLDRRQLHHVNGDPTDNSIENLVSEGTP